MYGARSVTGSYGAAVREKWRQGGGLSMTRTVSGSGEQSSLGTDSALVAEHRLEASAYSGPKKVLDAGRGARSIRGMLGQRMRNLLMPGQPLVLDPTLAAGALQVDAKV